MKEINVNRVDKTRWFSLVLMLLVGTTSAVLNCLSVYIGPLAERGWDSSIVISAFSVMMFMAVPGSIIGGKLKEKFGNRFVLKTCGLGFTLSVIAASFSTSAVMYVVFIGGFAPLFVYCIYVAQLANVGELFPDKRGLATGSVVVGVAVAGALVVPLAEWVTRIMEVMHGIAMFGIVFGGLTILTGFIMVEAPENYKPAGWVPKKYEILDANIANEGSGIKDISWKKVLTLKSFWFIFIGAAAASVFVMGIQSGFVLISANALDISNAKGAWLYTVLAISMGGSGIVVGWISDRVLGPVKIIVTTILLLAIIDALFVIIPGSNYGIYFLLVVMVGVVTGSINTLIPVIFMEAWGNKYFGINFGMFQCAGMIASFIGGQIAIQEPVINFFIIGAVVMIIGAVIFTFSGRALNKELGKKRF